MGAPLTPPPQCRPLPQGEVAAVIVFKPRPSSAYYYVRPNSPYHMCAGGRGRRAGGRGQQRQGRPASCLLWPRCHAGAWPGCLDRPRQPVFAPPLSRRRVKEGCRISKQSWFQLWRHMVSGPDAWDDVPGFAMLTAAQQQELRAIDPEQL